MQILEDIFDERKVNVLLDSLLNSTDFYHIIYVAFPGRFYDIYFVLLALKLRVKWISNSSLFDKKRNLVFV